MHNHTMRTTINLDDDVYQLATLYSRGRGISLSAALSEMVRNANSPLPSDRPSPRLVKAPNGLLVFAPRGRTITSEMVKEALEEDDHA